MELGVAADQVARIDIGPFAIAVSGAAPAGHGLADALIAVVLHRGLVFGHRFEPEADVAHRLALFVEPGALQLVMVACDICHAECC